MITSFEPPFLGARLKIDGANEHLETLDQGATKLASQCPVQIVTGPNEPGNFFITGITTCQMPAELSLVLGYAIHNLRSAFDPFAIVLTTQPIGKC